jgi:hypothetical protein
VSAGTDPGLQARSTLITRLLVTVTCLVLLFGAGLVVLAEDLLGRTASIWTLVAVVAVFAPLLRETRNAVRNRVR